MSDSPQKRSPSLNQESSGGQEWADTRSATAKAMAMVSQITTISIMMVLPALGGYYLDQYLGTVALFFFLGMLLGIVSAGYQFYKLIEYRNRQLEEEIKREHRVNNSEPRL